jgi:hypothetical protein
MRYLITIQEVPEQSQKRQVVMAIVAGVITIAVIVDAIKPRQ